MCYFRKRYEVYLVHIVGFYGGVKHGVEVVEEGDDLHGRAHGGDGGEAHDVAEVDSHLLKRLRLHRLPAHQALRHRPVQYTKGKHCMCIFLCMSDHEIGGLY